MFNTTKSKLKKIQQYREKADDASIKRLARIMLEETDEVVRGEAVRALGEIPSPDVTIPLVAALRNAAPHARASAAEALGRRGATDAVPELIEALGDRDDLVRMRVVEALGRIGDDRALAPLVASLGDPHWGVHGAAAEAVATFGDPRTFEPLRAWAESYLLSMHVKQNAEQKIARVQELISKFLVGIDEPTCRRLTANLGLQVRVKSWEITNARTDTGGWVVSSHKNPVWRPLQDRLNAIKEAYAKATPLERAEAATIPYQSPEPEKLRPVADRKLPFATPTPRPAPEAVGPPSEHAEPAPGGPAPPSPSSAAPESPAAPSALPPPVAEAVASSEVGTVPGGLDSLVIDEDAPSPFAAMEAASGSGPAESASPTLAAQTPAAGVAGGVLPPLIPESLFAGLDAEDIHDHGSPHGADVHPAPAPAAEPKTYPRPAAIAAPPAPSLPAPRGIVAELLDALRSTGLGDVVLAGGAPRDAALGREPVGLDLALAAIVAPALAAKASPGGDPVEWNLAFADVARDRVEKIAELAGCAGRDLLEGRARFAGTTELPLRWVGPWVTEERRSERNGAVIEQRIDRRASALALVADRRSGRILALADDLPMNRTWIDPAGSRGGDLAALAQVVETGEFDHDADPANAGWPEVLLVLLAKHRHGLALSERVVELLETAAGRLRDGIAPREEFSLEDYEALLECAPLERLARELDLLDLAPLLPFLGDSPSLRRVEEKLSDMEGEKALGMAARRQRLLAAEREREERKARYDQCHARFRDHFERMDLSKATKNDLEARLQERVGVLAEADQAARDAADRLAEATRRFRSIASGDRTLEPEVIQEHREALAENRRRVQVLDELKEEVESLRRTIAVKLRSTLQLQDEMERIGKELETASNDLRGLDAEVERTRAEMDAMEADMQMSPERRRSILRESASRPSLDASVAGSVVAASGASPSDAAPDERSSLDSAE